MDQGEVAFIIGYDGVGGYKIEGYQVSQGGQEFTETALRNAYLERAILEQGFEDKEREKIIKYLVDTRKTKPVEGSRSDRGTFGGIATQIHMTESVEEVPKQVFAATKKYKKVADKIRPVYQELPDKYRIVRDIKGDPLKNMPMLSKQPPEFVPTGRYSRERKEQMDLVHGGDFLWEEERKLVHQLIMQQNEAFAWDDTEKGSFKTRILPACRDPRDRACAMGIEEYSYSARNAHRDLQFYSAKSRSRDL